MTAIAYKDGILAADTLSWGGADNNVKVNYGPKIFRLNDNSLIAGTGLTGDCLKFREYMKKGNTNLDELKVDDSFNGIWIKPDGSIWECDRSLIFMRNHDGICALGASMDFLYGALRAGASAKQAIELAIEYTDSTAGTVQVCALNATNMD